MTARDASKSRSTTTTAKRRAKAADSGRSTARRARARSSDGHATSLPQTLVKRLSKSLAKVADAHEHGFPGDSGARQPVHTVYGGAHLFRSGSGRRLGELALGSLERHAPHARALAEALHLVVPPDAVGDPDGYATRVYERVVEKLRREPVEDFRIDFEDGYGNRPDEEEDGHAVAAAQQVADGLGATSLPPFIGIRVKPFSRELAARSLRTLDLFVTTLVTAAGRVPEWFAVTLPKIVAPGQVAALADAVAALEQRLSLPTGSIRIELMIETAQSVLTPGGASALPELVAAARGRCSGAHFGTYDYTAGMDVSAEYQTMDHPACDFAKHVMKVSLAGTGVALSDGATNVMPVEPHRPDRELTEDEARENQASVHRAWRLHYGHVRRSLVQGYYQGWDLHPAQLPTRYAAVYSFFFESLDAASRRLHNFLEQAAKATLVGGVFDDAATGQGLLNYFLRGVGCGALDETDLARAGLSMEELQTRSFLTILERRRAG